MKLILKTLVTSADTIQVSFDGVSYKSYDVENAKKKMEFCLLRIIVQI